MDLTEYSVICYLFLSFLLAFLLWFLISRKKSSNKFSWPPGPPGWLVIGNIFDVGMTPHQNMQKLGAKYGPILWLKLGMSNTLVIQSAKAAEELFKKHDLPFSDRKVFNSLTACDYDKGSLVIAHYGDYWRIVRKLCSSDLLSQKRITASAQTRQNCIDVMMQWIKEDVHEGSGEILLEKYLFLMTFNLVSNFAISRNVMESKSEKGNEFYETMTMYLQWSGIPNLVDSFPFFKYFDPQRIRKNTGKYLDRLINIASEFVKERIQDKLSGKENETRDFLDALLEHIDELSERNIAIVVMEMFIAGTETTSSTINWGMAELLNNPESLSKLREELDLVIGRSRKVEESDLKSLPYLEAVVKETMRLHPSLPFLVPRNVMEDTNFMGYFIPKDTMVLLNVWAIQRDPDSWDDPLSFKPERFIGSKIDLKGHHYELIPFGSGRRSCIGMNLGEKMVSLTLAKLIQDFDWKLPVNVSSKTMDMREKPGISVRMLVPLKVFPTERKYI